MLTYCLSIEIGPVFIYWPPFELRSLEYTLALRRDIIKYNPRRGQDGTGTIHSIEQEGRIEWIVNGDGTWLVPFVLYMVDRDLQETISIAGGGSSSSSSAHWMVKLGIYLSREIIIMRSAPYCYQVWTYGVWYLPMVVSPQLPKWTVTLVVVGGGCWGRPATMLFLFRAGLVRMEGGSPSFAR